MVKKYIWSFLTLLLMFGTISLIGCGKKEEEYRQIQVYKIDGTAKVARQGSSMDAYENMQLQSGDIIETIAESYLQLKLDEDKYILVEPDSKISLQATGNSVDSKTSIYLEKGAIVNQLDNPLSKDSSYEVTTPNSTMAVRGTTFRVEITYDEKGDNYAKVSVYDGKVECNLVFPDGTITEPVMVEADTEVMVWGDDIESDYIWSGKTDYEDLRLKVLDFLGVIIDRGEELSITKEEIEVLKEAKELLEQEEGSKEEIEEQETEEDKEAEKENSEEPKSLNTEESGEPEVSNQPTEQNPESNQNEPESSTDTPGSDNMIEDNASNESADGGSYDDSSDGGNTGGGNTGGENTGGGNTGGGDDTSGGDASGGDTSGDDTSGGDTPGDDTSGGDDTIQAITVEFYCNGLFASGSINPDTNNIITVSCPALMPTREGYWQMEGGDVEALKTGGMVEVDVSNLDSVVFTWIDETNNTQ